MKKVSDVKYLTELIYFATIDKQLVLQLILISLVGIDVSAKGFLMWEEDVEY